MKRKEKLGFLIDLNNRDTAINFPYFSTTEKGNAHFPICCSYFNTVILVIKTLIGTENNQWGLNKRKIKKYQKFESYGNKTSSFFFF